MRIARELHDVVAHHIAVINVQAGSPHTSCGTTRPVREEALAHVRRGAASVLDELSSILSVIRQSDEPTSTTDPLPTLDDLQRLIADFTSVGLEIEWHTAGARPTGGAGGRPRRLPDHPGIADQRPSPRLRHHRATLRLTYEPDTLQHRDPQRHRRRPTGRTGRRGHGTIGMRERVAAAGGTIEIGPTADGQFRVHATLPVTEQAER